MVMVIIARLGQGKLLKKRDQCNVMCILVLLLPYGRSFVRHKKSGQSKNLHDAIPHHLP